jgi:hypothetical protein
MYFCSALQGPVRVVMSDFLASLNDRTADDEPAKKKPKTLSGYFDLFDLCIPGHDTLLTSFVSGSSYHCMSGQSKIIVLTLVVPATRKSDTAHSFLRGPSSQPSAGRDGHFSSSLSAKNGWTPCHGLDLNMKAP